MKFIRIIDDENNSIKFINLDSVISIEFNSWGIDVFTTFENFHDLKINEKSEIEFHKFLLNKETVFAFKKKERSF